MAKLYYRYGAMGSSKTANAIMVWYNYKERCKNALLVKPGVDTRDGTYTIRSRSGLVAECILFDQIDWTRCARTNTTASSLTKRSSSPSSRWTCSSPSWTTTTYRLSAMA
jgi:thymidine kinase